MAGFYRPGQRNEQRMRRFMSISGAGITGPVVGLDPYFSSVISLLHFEGTNGSPTFTDQKPVTWAPAVNAQITTAQFRYGAASMQLGTSADGSYISTSGITSLSATAWTAEMSTRLTSSLSSGQSTMLLRAGNASGFGIRMFLVNNTPGAPDSTHTFVRLYLSSNGTSDNIANGVYSTALSIGAGAWNDFSLVFTGSAYVVYINGTAIITVTSSAAICAFSGIQLGGSPGGTQFTLQGQMDEWRLTNGVARYTGAYTPSGPFPDS